MNHLRNTDLCNITYVKRINADLSITLKSPLVTLNALRLQVILGHLAV